MAKFLISKYLLMLVSCVSVEREIWEVGADGGIKFSLYKIPNILFWVQVIDFVMLHF